MSASSNLFSNFLARHTQPRGYVASGDDNNNNNYIDSNDSLTFDLDSKTGQWLTPNFHEPSLRPRLNIALFSLLTLWTSRPFCEAVEIVLYVFRRSFLLYVLMYFAAPGSITTFLPPSFSCCVLSLGERGDALSYMNLKGRYILTTDVCHLVINAKLKSGIL
jgi:hypothetical protein